MDEQQPAAAPARNPSEAPGWSDHLYLALLLVLVVGMRIVQVCRTEVTSRDSVSYIRIAWQLEHGNWREVIPTATQHPGYPLTILALSLPVRPFIADLAQAMQLSAQLASSLASILLVLPMFYLGKELFDRRVGFWAALLYQCIPTSGRIMADGLSEPLFLFLAATALLFACRALRTSSPGCFALTGVMGGLAYLTRPEGALVPLATGLVLLGMQMGRGSRRSWGSVLRCGTSLSAAVLLVALPFMLLIQGITVKPSGKRIVDAPVAEEGPAWAPPGKTGEPGAQRSESPLPFAIWYNGPHLTPADRVLWGFYALGIVLHKGFFYVLWAPALVGLWVFRERFRLVPGAWVLLLVCLMLAALLYRLAQIMGYSGERHILLIVLAGLYWAVATVVQAGRLVGGTAKPQAAAVLANVALLGLALAPLPKTLAPLHADRAGFRQAGAWLAHHASPEDEVVDPYTWATFYSGREFLPRKTGASSTPGRVCYVVLEKSSNSHPHIWFLLEKAEQLARTGVEETYFPVKRGKEEVRVVIYKVCRR
jgi:hypothetical protein